MTVTLKCRKLLALSECIIWYYEGLTRWCDKILIGVQVCDVMLVCGVTFFFILRMICVCILSPTPSTFSDEPRMASGLMHVKPRTHPILNVYLTNEVPWSFELHWGLEPEARSEYRSNGTDLVCGECGGREKHQCSPDLLNAFSETQLFLYCSPIAPPPCS